MVQLDEYDNRRFMIFNVSELNQIDFNTVLETSAETVRKWIPKWQENQDPSGRANAAHVQADVEIAK